MPDDTEMRTSFDSFFYIYQPKDIVSGDFYWFHDFGDTVVCAVGDCTGHGVPGALMSVICVSQINKHVKSDSVKSPEHALNLINDGIVETLKQQEVNVNSYDGMDIAMCAYNKKTGVLNYAGAYRPLIIVRNKELLEFAPNRFSLGGEIMPSEEYIGHHIELQPTDCVYMFTDGYPDQFGGPRNKKYLSKRFKELLVEISHLSFEEQQKVLEDRFINWKKDNEQVDDILVMGFKA
jgi:serine phosphatase RsbU (regulator of sigma subunit)